MLFLTIEKNERRAAMDKSDSHGRLFCDETTEHPNVAALI